MLQHRKDVRKAQRQLAELRARFGDDSPQVVTAAINLAAGFRMSGDFRRAIELRAHVVEMQRRRHGDDSYEVISALESLADLHAASGDFTSARAIQKDVVDRLLAHCDVNDRVVIRSKVSLAKSQHQSGDVVSSYKTMSEVVASSMVTFGRYSPEAFENGLYLADILRQLGRYNEAKELDLRIARGAARFGADPHLVLTAWRGVLEDCSRLGDTPGEVRALRSIVMMASSFPEDDVARSKFATMELGIAALRDQIVAELGEGQYQDLLRMLRPIE